MTSGRRVVLDANVCVSGLINPDGPPGQCLELVRTRELIPVASAALMTEIRDVISRPKLAKYLLDDRTFDDLAPAFQVVDVKPYTGPPLHDPDDEHVIAAAISGDAVAIVTGDKRDLLRNTALGEWLKDHSVALVTPRLLIAAITSSS